MKISPITPAQAGSPSANIHGAVEGASPDKIARAKAIAAGQGHEISITPSDTPQEKAPDVRRIKMNVNRTVYRDGAPSQEGSLEAESQMSPEVPVEVPATADNNANPPVIEDTKPLSPQFAALAKQRRALQAKERELADREKALASSPASAGTEELVARLKSQPLSVLQEHGVTYDQLTEAILSNQAGNPEIAALKAELKALKEGVDKTLSDKDAQAERQVLQEIRRESERLARTGETYEMVRETNSYPDVVELIHRTWKQDGEILDVSEAMQLVEDELVKESLKIANIGKVRSQLKLPAPVPTPQQQPNKQIKTLTNRDTARPLLDRRARAIAAALGNLKR